jgi:hypothetical protein
MFRIFVLFVIAISTALSTATIGDLTTNYLEDPMGLDVIPRFSWILQSSNASSQTAYRVQISNKEDDFENLVFDSGYVSENRNYLNTPSNLTLDMLKPSTDYFWRGTHFVFSREIVTTLTHTHSGGNFERS